MKNSKRVAFGGVISALCLSIMSLSGIIPLGEYVLPAIAGTILIALVIELSRKTALVSFVAVALLSLLILPNKEPAIIFSFFMGYYPIIKSNIEQLKSRVLEWIIKILLFNITMVSAYLVMIHLMGMTQLLEDLVLPAEYGIAVLLVLGNVTFFMYDLAITRMVVLYQKLVRPKLKFFIKK